MGDMHYRDLFIYAVALVRFGVNQYAFDFATTTKWRKAIKRINKHG